MAETTVARKKVVNFYVDGFNFYYGLKDMTKMKPDWRKFYWIDLVKLFEQYLLDDEVIGVVHYFTARPKNTGKTARQNIFMNCNKAINGDRLKIHYGKYQDKSITCRGTCKQQFMHWEEKQTDVNLAIKMVEECHYKNCEKIILVSGDSDFLPPLNLILNYYKEKEISVLFPPCKYTQSIENLKIPTISMGIHKPRWNRAKLDPVVNVNNKTYRIPTEWA